MNVTAINSKYDKQTLEANKDYSMTSPLEQDGSNYPCKVSFSLSLSLYRLIQGLALTLSLVGTQGYNTPHAYSTLSSVATLQAGTDFEIEFAPNGATHEGGSCQFSVRRVHIFL